ncbi:MAG TPA: hypothetical protein VKP65_20285 [Rhodothermales bacterium]|nr:hypothetical protein [Rhodothermales bacterium]
MNWFDRQFQPGSLFMLTLMGAATLLMFAYGLFIPEQRYVSWFMGCFGLYGLFQSYQTRQRKAEAT